MSLIRDKSSINIHQSPTSEMGIWVGRCEVCPRDMGGLVPGQSSQLYTVSHLAMGSSTHLKSLRAPTPTPANPLSLDIVSIRLLARLSSTVLVKLRDADKSPGEPVSLTCRMGKKLVEKEIDPPTEGARRQAELGCVSGDWSLGVG